MPMDPGYEGTEALLEELEERIHAEYKQAASEAQEKATARLRAFQEQMDKQKELLEQGEITLQEYREWARRQTYMNKQLQDIADDLAHDYHNANLIAAKIANGAMPDVYALNANYATWAIEHYGQIDTGFTLYNHDTAEMLLRDDRADLLPPPSAKKRRELAQNPDLVWNKQHIQSALLQGVLQGEPAGALAERLAGVAIMDEHAAIRNARTMTTNVQNAGRQRAYDRAKGLGVDLVLEWSAILDGVTRHSHRQMHGERKVNDRTVKFSNGCRWPGDPQGPAAEVYNCRCTTLSWVEGFEGDTVTSSPVMGKVTFEEWQMQRPKSAKRPGGATSNQSNGVDITGRWYPNAVPGSHKVQDAEEYKAPDGTVYKVHDRDVVLDYTSREKEIAEILEREIGGELFMVPRVNRPEGVSTPDFLFNGRRYDLKVITGNGKNTLSSAISSKKRQSNSFVFDMTGSPMLEAEVDRQINGIFRSDHTRFVQEIIVIRDQKIVRVLRRK